MATPGFESDYFALQPLILARLNTMFVDEVRWEPVKDITQVLERGVGLGLPVGFVLWDGDRVSTGDSGVAAGGSAQVLYQRWTLLLGVRNASQANLAAPVAEGGPLLMRTLKALAGWRPIPGYMPSFVRTTGRGPTYVANGALLPLTFEIKLFL